MIAGSVARRYARALLDIGLAGNSADPLGKELEGLVAVMHGSAELTSALQDFVLGAVRVAEPV